MKLSDFFRRKAGSPVSAPASTGVSPDLVFDVGMNHGEDTRYYLDKGFRVVAVEANPLISAECTERFAAEIAQGRLTVVAAGIAAEAGTLKFYRNIDNDHWSSFDPVYGCRDGTAFEVLEVDCITPDDLVRNFGVPRYMKIDVEGVDRIILSRMQAWRVRPDFVSVEEYGPAAIHDMARIGYECFQIVRQGSKLLTVPNPAREGSFVEAAFSGRDSGPFGLDLPLEGWLDEGQVTQVFSTLVRQPDGRYVGPQGEWFDIHGSTWNAVRRPAGRNRSKT